MKALDEQTREILATLTPAPTDAERDRAVEHWLEVIRPGLPHDSEPYGPVEPPELKLLRLKRTIWAEPVIIGAELGAKLAAMARQQAAELSP